jgi:type II secretory pathway pseudopilin PulG
MIRRKQSKGISRRDRSQLGFTLLETTIALLITAGAIMSLALILGDSLAYMNFSQDEFICQQKAAEAAESVFTARDTGILTWAQIDNIGGGGNGVFSSAFLPLVDPGPDGIVGTADDVTANPDVIRDPGPDGILGNSDDRTIPLQNFTRQILIADNAYGNANLKKITITVVYTSGKFKRTYVLTTYISAFT